MYSPWGQVGVGLLVVAAAFVFRRFTPRVEHTADTGLPIGWRGMLQDIIFFGVLAAGVAAFLGGLIRIVS